MLSHFSLWPRKESLRREVSRLAEKENSSCWLLCQLLFCSWHFDEKDCVDGDRFHHCLPHVLQTKNNCNYLFMEGQFICLGDNGVRPLWASRKIAHIGSLVWHFDQSSVDVEVSAQWFQVAIIYNQIIVVIRHLLPICCDWFISSLFFRSVGQIPFRRTFFRLKSSAGQMQLWNLSPELRVE